MIKYWYLVKLCSPVAVPHKVLATTVSQPVIRMSQEDVSQMEASELGVCFRKTACCMGSEIDGMIFKESQLES